MLSASDATTSSADHWHASSRRGVKDRAFGPRDGMRAARAVAMRAVVTVPLQRRDWAAASPTESGALLSVWATSIAGPVSLDRAHGLG